MQFPEYFTREDIMEFEYDLNRQIDIDREEGQFWAVNAELQFIAEEQRSAQVEVEADFLVLEA